MRESSRALVAGLLVIAAFAASAQEASYDGKRWYAVEVSIFTNEVPGGTRTEIPVARKLTAAYLPRLRELTNRASAFMIDFPEDRVPSVQPSTVFAPEVAPAAVPATPVEPAVTMGPIYSPALRDAFKIIDFERDPFVDLDTRIAQFGAMNRSIEGAPDHRLLWHKAWHQPLEARAQTAAVFVAGGELRGTHYELEGSLRVVDNAGGAMLDVNVWLNEFRPGLAPASVVLPAVPAMEAEWKIPELPFPPALDARVPVAATWDLAAVWQLAQTRELGANQLYYLDHPALGMLIQVRPYLLPPPLPSDLPEDF